MSFRPPDRRADDRPLDPPVRWDVAVAVPGEFARAGRVVKSGELALAPGPANKGDSPGKKNRQVVPPVETRFGAKDLPDIRLEGSRLDIAVTITDGRGRRSVSDGPASIEPAPPLPSPADLSARVEQGGVALVWTLPAIPQLPGAAPLVRIYRHFPATPGEPLAIADLPAGSVSWLDAGAPFGTRQVYSVRLATPAPAGTAPVQAGIGARHVPAPSTRRESRPSGAVEVDVLDTFAPEPPGDLAISAGPASMHIFWNPGRDEDLAGWVVSRAAGPAPADGDFRMVATLPAAQTAWEDRDISPGTVYSYRVTAIDTARPPNESAPAQAGPEPALSRE